MATFNIKSKSIQESSTLHLRDVETEELLYADEKQTIPLTISMYGKASKEYRQALSEMVRKNSTIKGTPTFEQNVAANDRLLAKICIAAEGFDMGNGAINSFDKFLELFSDPALYWVKDQVSAHQEDVAAFLQK